MSNICDAISVFLKDCKYNTHYTEQCVVWVKSLRTYVTTK